MVVFLLFVLFSLPQSKRTSQETEVHFSRVKRTHLLVVIGRFRFSLFVSFFQGSLAVAIIVTDSSENRNRQLGLNFRVRMLLKGAIRTDYLVLHEVPRCVAVMI